MSRNYESPATIINGQQVHDTDMEQSAKDKYAERVKGLTISEETGKFLECIMMLDDLYIKVREALTTNYNNEMTETLLDENYRKPIAEIENFIFDYFKQSVIENVFTIDFTEI